MGSWVFVIWLVIEGEHQQWTYHFEKQWKCQQEYTRIVKERLDQGIYDSVKTKRCEWQGIGVPKQPGGWGRS